MMLRLKRFVLLAGLLVAACSDDDAASLRAQHDAAAVDARGGTFGDSGPGGHSGAAAGRDSGQSGDRDSGAKDSGTSHDAAEDADGAPASGGGRGTGGANGSGGAAGAGGGIEAGGSGVGTGGILNDGGPDAGDGASGSPGVVIACIADADCVAGSVCVVGACIAGNCATDSACTTGQICGGDSPYSCADCRSDLECRSDPTYGPATVCTAGACTRGDCHDDADCARAAVCGLVVPNTCAPCSADSDCVAAAGYGGGYVCDSGACVRTTCTADGECAPGQICGLATPGVCAVCGSDADCRTDPTYGSATICVGGACTAGDCHGSADCGNGGICGVTSPNSCGPCDATAACRADPAYGSLTICAAGVCTPGNCATSTDCAGGQICGAANPNYCGVCSTDGECQNDPAYGATHLCVVGACVAGNCEHSSDCMPGNLCGVTSPSVCGTCTADAQCRNDPKYGDGYVCNVGSGKCVAAACNANGQACEANAADFCCDATCVPGNCCSDTDCAPLGASHSCIGHVCTTCAAPPGTTYFVDPKNGSDDTGTGDATLGCAFKTVTRALSFIGASPSADTKILVLPSGDVSAGEVFPIVVPENVTVSGSGGKVTVIVRPGVAGFVLNQRASGLADLVIDGQNRAALVGVAVSPSSTAAVTIANVNVRQFESDGIRVEGQATLAVSGGTTSIGNGVPGGTGAGLRVGGKANVVVDPSGGSPIHFDGNAGFGIAVGGTAFVRLAGAPGSGASGTVTTNANGSDGLFVGQTPIGSPLPENSIDGLVTVANGASGIAITAGSRVTVRGCRSLGNGRNGVSVSPYVIGPIRNSSVSEIDLGRAGDPGGNTFQAAIGAGSNLDAGICLTVARTAGQILAAAGNVFAGPTDCAAAPAILTTNTECSNAVDFAIAGGRPTSNSIVLSQCQ